MPRRLPVIAVLCCSALAAGCMSTGDGRNAGQDSAAEKRRPAERAPAARSGEVTVARAKRTIEAAYVVGDSVHGLEDGGKRGKLAAGVVAPLVGTLAPAAVPDPGRRRRIAYHAFANGRPVLRIHEAGRRNDAVLDEGAYSLAWRADGAVAYFKGPADVPEDVRRYLGHVVVRRSVSGTPVRWTRTRGRYVVAAWARDRLLVYRLTRGFPDLLVLDAARRQRLLARRTALIAVSPDGTRAMLTAFGGSGPAVRLVRLSDGQELDRYAVGGAGATPEAKEVSGFGPSGSWSGDLVFAASNVGVTVFRVRAHAVELEQVVSFDAETFPAGVSGPRSEDGRRMFVTAELLQRVREAIPRAVLLECDRLSLRCSRGPVASAVQPPTLVYNPSRP